MKKVAFCFLLYDSVKHPSYWEDFFDQDDKDTHTVYSHLKKTTDKTQHWIKRNRVKTVKTDYCAISLVHAWIQMLRKALKNNDNQYFCILSGECIPLFPYKQVYSKITRSKKSRVNLDMLAEVYVETGWYYADQWVILTRREAKLLVKLRDTKEGRQFSKKVTQDIGDFCPDEVIPVNWFVKHYGKPSSKKYRKHIRNIYSTYTFWDGIHYSPRKFTAPQLRSMRDKICSSKAVFGRKFYATAAKQLAMKC